MEPELEDGAVGVGRLIMRWQVGQEETVENQVARQYAWTVHPRRVTGQGNNSGSGQVRDHETFSKKGGAPGGRRVNTYSCERTEGNIECQK